MAEVKLSIKDLVNDTTSATSTVKADTPKPGSGSTVTERMDGYLNCIVDGKPYICELYTVVKGDNLSKIAAKYGTNFELIAKINGIKNANLIEIGQRLCVPRDVDFNKK